MPATSLASSRSSTSGLATRAAVELAAISAWTSYDVPRRVNLLDRNGKLVTRLFEITVEDRAPYKFSKPEIHRVKGKDGIIFYGTLLKPLDFDPKKKYPVISYVYGEPAGQVVVNRWMSSSQQVLLNHGFLVWRFDGRGTPGRGRAFLSHGP